jgi:hypothetical protein
LLPKKSKYPFYFGVYKPPNKLNDQIYCLKITTAYKRCYWSDSRNIGFKLIPGFKNTTGEKSTRVAGQVKRLKNLPRCLAIVGQKLAKIGNCRHKNFLFFNGFSDRFLYKRGRKPPLMTF